MRHLTLLIAALLGFTHVIAQERATSDLSPTLMTETPPVGFDSIVGVHLNTHGQVMRPGAYPYYLGGWQSWHLHQGLNMSLGASVSGMFGKHAPHGIGFGQNIALMYVQPLSDRLSLAVGGYFSNLTWSRQSYRNAGVSAALGYRFDEHWEGYLYAQKSIMHSYRYPLPLYDVGDVGDRIGAAVRYNFSPSFWMQVSVEAAHYDSPHTIHNPIERFEYKRE